MTDTVRVGVLGGTFDPIHVGHLAAARVAQDTLRLTEVRFIPSYHPPHRPGAPLAPGNARLAMIQLAIADTPGWRASDLELTRRGTSYTYDTLTALQGEGLMSWQIFFILGADAFAEIRTWSRYPAVLDAAHFVVVERHGTKLRRIPEQVPEIAARLVLVEDTADRGAQRGGRADVEAAPEHSEPTRVIFIEADTPDVSSTMVRERVQHGDDIADLVTRDVADFITRHGLYRTSEGALAPAVASGR